MKLEIAEKYYTNPLLFNAYEPTTFNVNDPANLHLGNLIDKREYYYSPCTTSTVV